jgi:Glycosyl hydrolases family 16
VVLVAAGCGGGGGDGGRTGGDGRDDRDVEQPVADTEALEPALAELLARHDEVVNEVLGDFTVARDADNPLLREYVGLYSPDSSVPEQVVAAWVADAETGRVVHPAEPGHPAVASRIDGEIETVADGKVRFPTCSELRYASYGAGGELLEMVPYREQAGQALAVRADGQWLLLRLDAFAGQACCRTPAAAEQPPDTTVAQCPTGTGRTAAEALGYTTPAFSDDFTTFDEQKWLVYGGPSEHRYGQFPAQGGGRRTREQISVADGVMTITGLPNGDTAGMSTDRSYRQRYGLWEARVELPSNAVNYHSVFMVMAGGTELDFAEAMEPTGRKIDAFLHLPGGEQNGSVTLSDNDWHNWAIEWTAEGISLYLDGRKWHETTRGPHIASGDGAMTIQLDWFPVDQGRENTATTELAVDWVRIYAPRPAQAAGTSGDEQGCSPCPGRVDSLGQCVQGLPGGTGSPTDGCG